jgi:hypothetical protein
MREQMKTMLRRNKIQRRKRPSMNSIKSYTTTSRYLCTLSTNSNPLRRNSQSPQKDPFKWKRKVPTHPSYLLNLKFSREGSLKNRSTDRLLRLILKLLRCICCNSSKI